MFLYTLRSLETPFHEPVLGQFLDENVALEAADNALPSCVGLVVVEKWPITKNASVTPPSKDKCIAGVECKRIYEKEGTRKLTKSQESAYNSQFI